MVYVTADAKDGIGTIVLRRGKVNALNGQVVSEIADTLESFEADAGIRSVILTGQGKFFSFGFDIPHFLSYGKAAFAEYLTRFAKLYTDMFQYPKPLVVAVNGHAIAGGCMLTLAGDVRLMAAGRSKISLNEIGFGSSVFAGSVEMLRFWVGGRKATEILYSAEMYSAEEAAALGLIDTVTSETDLQVRAREAAAALGEKPSAAFAGIKMLLRRPALEEMQRKESNSIREFVDIWYSEDTWANLKAIKIY